MNIRLPWLYSRRKMIIGIISEILLIFVLNKYLFSDYLLFTNSVDLFSILFIFFWINFSYVFGRYTYSSKIYKSKNIVSFLKLIIITLLIANLSMIMVLIISMKVNLNNYNDFDKVIIFYTSFISISINIIQFPLINKIVKYSQNIENWFFLGPLEIIPLIKKELKWSRKLIKVIHIQDLNNSVFLEHNKIDGIFIHKFNSIDNINLKELLRLKNSGLKIYSLGNWCENYLHKLPCDIITFEFLLDSKIPIFDNLIQLRIKRLGDILLSILLLFLTLPILLISSLIIFLEDRNNFLYKQKRVGRNQKIFTLYKLRTMKINAEEGKPQWSKKLDKRVTKFGKFLRKSRIDELPQLFNVIIGDMSLIGPRPEREIFDKKLKKHIPKYDNRYYVRPGLSGWAQVNFPYGSSLEDAKHKFSYDIFYLKNFSTWLDFLILLKTIKLVLLKKGSEPIR